MLVAIQRTPDHVGDVTAGLGSDSGCALAESDRTGQDRVATSDAMKTRTRVGAIAVLARPVTGSLRSGPLR
jgi:hypothetical protein